MTVAVLASSESADAWNGVKQEQQQQQQQGTQVHGSNDGDHELARGEKRTLHGGLKRLSESEQQAVGVLQALLPSTSAFTVRSQLLQNLAHLHNVKVDETSVHEEHHDEDEDGDEDAASGIDSDEGTARANKIARLHSATDSVGTASSAASAAALSAKSRANRKKSSSRGYSTAWRRKSNCHYCEPLGENCGLVAGKCPNRPCKTCNNRHRLGRCRKQASSSSSSSSSSSASSVSSTSSSSSSSKRRGQSASPTCEKISPSLALEKARAAAASTAPKAKAKAKATVKVLNENEATSLETVAAEALVLGGQKPSTNLTFGALKSLNAPARSPSSPVPSNTTEKQASDCDINYSRSPSPSTASAGTASLPPPFSSSNASTTAAATTTLAHHSTCDPNTSATMPASFTMQPPRPSSFDISDTSSLSMMQQAMLSQLRMNFAQPPQCRSTNTDVSAIIQEQLRQLSENNPVTSGAQNEATANATNPPTVATNLNMNTHANSSQHGTGADGRVWNMIRDIQQDRVPNASFPAVNNKTPKPLSLLEGFMPSSAQMPWASSSALRTPTALANPYNLSTRNNNPPAPSAISPKSSRSARRAVRDVESSSFASSSTSSSTSSDPSPLISGHATKSTASKGTDASAVTSPKREAARKQAQPQSQQRQYTMMRKRSECHFCKQIGQNCGRVAGKCPNRPCNDCGGRHRHGRCRLKRAARVFAKSAASS